MPSLEDTSEQGAEEAIVEHKINYDYLLSMPISSLTLEKVSWSLHTTALQSLAQ